jgi:hypothetical protein
MSAGQGTATIIDHFVMSLAMNPVIRRDLKIEKEMEYWQVKKLVINAYGNSLHGEVLRLATMDWEQLASEFMEPICALLQGTLEGKRKLNKLLRLLDFKKPVIEDLDAEQRLLLKGIIQELQSSWKQCLPQAAVLTEI